MNLAAAVVVAMVVMGVGVLLQILTRLPAWVSSYRVIDAASKPGTTDVETIWCT
jgi:hypothetical protein